MAEQGRLLARGPWRPGQVESVWRDETWVAPADVERRADAAVDELRERGSPAHDGEAARLAAWKSDGDTLRLVDAPGTNSLTALCLVRTEDGRWLAGRRASWLASWADRWALGAGGAVEVGEDPSETLSRELDEEWQLTPQSLSVEALVYLPSGLVALVGLATVPSGAEPVPDAEHDEFAWWPADVGSWPDEADQRLQLLARSLER